MMNSSSSTHHFYADHRFESIHELKTTHNSVKYDATGAALFILTVLLWYAMGLVCMLGIRIRARSETIEEFARRRAKFVVENIRDQIQKKDILEELADREKRAKLWEIYWGSSKAHPDELRRAELERIRKIKKQLAMIDRNRIIMNDTFISPVINRPSPSEVPTTGSAGLVIHV